MLKKLLSEDAKNYAATYETIGAQGSQIASGLIGLLREAYGTDVLGESLDEARDKGSELAKAYSYMPRTERGKAINKTINDVMSNTLGLYGKGVSKVADLAKYETGSDPLAGTTELAGNLLPALLGEYLASGGSSVAAESGTALDSALKAAGSAPESIAESAPTIAGNLKNAANSLYENAKESDFPVDKGNFNTIVKRVSDEFTDGGRKPTSSIPSAVTDITEDK